MKLIIFSILFIGFFLFREKIFAQVETGKESQVGTLNINALANYLLSHPKPLTIKKPANEEDESVHFVRPLPDSSMIHTCKAGAAGAYHTTDTSSYLPVSPAPTDTFESTLDNGTTIPPDTHGAVDATYCVSALNSAVHIQTRTGRDISSVPLDDFWSPVLPGGGSFDPRIHYDLYTNRWIVVSASGAKTTASSILIAISKTGDPTGSWWEYKIVADVTGVNWFDFPNIGFNSKWITITGNLFANSGGASNGAKVFVFNKANLLSGAGASYTSFLQTNAFSICPAITYSATESSLFAVETWNGSTGLMRVWKITGPVGAESMTSVGYPASPLHWWYTSYAFLGTSGADFAPQAGTTDKVQTNDDRVTQVVFMNNNLWFAHTVFLPYSLLSNPTRASVQWWQTDTFANPLQHGTIDDVTSANFYAFPSIAVNTNNDALVGFSAFSASTYPSCAYAMHLHTDPSDSTRPLVIYRHGMNTYYKTFSLSKNRWGDFSATMPDPINLTDFWTIQEASAPAINTWDTWWAHVSLCTPPAAISGPANGCIGHSYTFRDATAGGSWQSSNAIVATIGASTGITTGISSGMATISYVLPTGCMATTVITITSCSQTGIAQIEDSNGLVIIPNPNKGEFSISGTLAPLSNSSGEIFVNVTDLVGQVKYTGKITSLSGRINEHISMGNSIPNGTYIVHIRSGAQNKACKITITP